jgi:serine phosphatase RsbU (regulator of sigma subunit)
MQDEVLADTFASLLIVRWDSDSNLLTFANAGHPRPVHSAAGGATIVEASDLILGLDANAEFHDSQIQLAPGDAFVAYTDGLMEQRLASGDMVGERGVVSLVAAARMEGTPIESMLQRILQESRDAEFTDDVLVFWLQRLAS